jgi:ferritin-like metal-binding protein YciE
LSVNLAGVEVSDSATAQLACLLHHHGEGALALHVGRALDRKQHDFAFTTRDREAVLRVLSRCCPTRLADVRAPASTVRSAEYATGAEMRIATAPPPPRFSLGVLGSGEETEPKGVLVAQLDEKLIKYIDEAYAMEQNVLRMLDGMIETTDDPQMKSDLKQHKMETEQQAERLKQRLEAHDAAPSVVKEASGIIGAMMKGVVDLARADKAGRNARDGYATEHMEIASYQLLERVATQAGDEETAAVARQNREEEEAMAAKIDRTWDKAAALSLEQEGVTA